MNNEPHFPTRRFSRFWYLGFLGLIGFAELPPVISFFQGTHSAWALTGLLWFLWFSHFIPHKSTPVA